MSRVFIYDGRDFEDPDPKMSTDDVRQSLVPFFPELANADTTAGKRKRKDNPAIEDDTYEFKRRTGTKGR